MIRLVTSVLALVLMVGCMPSEYRNTMERVTDKAVENDPLRYYTPELLEVYRDLPRLPKPTLLYVHANNSLKNEYNRAWTREVIRIAGTVGVRSDLYHKRIRSSDPPGSWNRGLFELAKDAGVSDVVIYLEHLGGRDSTGRSAGRREVDSLDDWVVQFGSEHEKLRENLSRTVEQITSNGLRPRWIVFGSESLGMCESLRPVNPRIAECETNSWNEYLDAYYNSIYGICESTTPDYTEIVYYSRGQFSVNAAGGDGTGFSKRLMYTLRERGTRLNVDGYDCSQPDALRMQVNRVCREAYERGRNESVAFWTSIGATYDHVLPKYGHSNEVKRFRSVCFNPINLWYVSRWLHWESEGWVKRNNGTPLFQRKYGEAIEGRYPPTNRMYAGDVDIVVLHPNSGLTPTYPHWPIHFLYWVKGAFADTSGLTSTWPVYEPKVNEWAEE
jgi:hypothetical protein